MLCRRRNVEARTIARSEVFFFSKESRLTQQALTFDRRRSYVQFLAEEKVMRLLYLSKVTFTISWLLGRPCTTEVPLNPGICARRLSRQHRESKCHRVMSLRLKRAAQQHRSVTLEPGRIGLALTCLTKERST